MTLKVSDVLLKTAPLFQKLFETVGQFFQEIQPVLHNSNSYGCP